MGGLVARSYIQSADYQNDIDRFAMIGTPNHGSAIAYPMWDGGDPFSADVMALEWPPIPVYTPTTVYLAKGSNEAKGAFEYLADTIKSGICGTMGVCNLLCMKNKMISYKDVYTYIKKNVPSLSQLMPTYNFLNPYGELQCERNTWLENLNENSKLSLLAREDETDPAKIRTMIFPGEGIDTVSSVKVGLKWCSNPYYPAGMLRSFEKNTAGDGTVPTLSAVLGNGPSYGSTKKEKHAKLVKVFAGDAADFIDASVTASSLLTMSAASESDSPAPVLSIATLGRVRPLITSPTGEKSGIENNLSVNEITGTTVSIGMDAGGISIENAADGEYSVTLTNGSAEDYQLTISYVDALGKASIISERGFVHSTSVSIPFTLNTSATQKLTTNHTPLPPANLQPTPMNRAA